jgi:hypothetical protein
VSKEFTQGNTKSIGEGEGKYSHVTLGISEWMTQNMCLMWECLNQKGRALARTVCGALTDWREVDRKMDRTLQTSTENIRRLVKASSQSHILQGD